MKFLSGLLVGIVLAILIAAVVAGVLSAGIPVLARDDGCAADAPDGTALSPVTTDAGVERSGDRATRTVTYALDPGDEAHRLAADLCTSVGDVRIRPSPDDVLRVVFHVSASGPRADDRVEDADADAAFARRADGSLALAAWRGPAAPVVWPFGAGGVQVSTTLEVPAGMVADVGARSNVGAVSLVDVAAGDLDLATDVGDVVLEPASVSRDIRAAADVGSVTVLLPEGAYQVTATADVGDVTVDLGPDADVERERSGPGETIRARTEGATPLDVDASADVGDVRVQTG